MVCWNLLYGICQQDLANAMPRQVKHVIRAGKVESNGDSGSILQQLSYRKAAMFALAKQAEASSQAASRNAKELKHSQAMIKELKAQLAKVTLSLHLVNS